MARKRSANGKAIEQDWLQFIHRTANGSRDNSRSKDRKADRRDNKTSRILARED